jgi:hypothetical protein
MNGCMSVVTLRDVIEILQWKWSQLTINDIAVLTLWHFSLMDKKLSAIIFMLHTALNVALSVLLCCNR